MNTQSYSVIGNVTKVYIQRQFRLDSALASYLAYSNPQHFPGVSGAGIVLWSTGTHADKNGATVAELEEQGCLFFGVGGTRFDEHPSAQMGDGKARGESACLLVARYCGIDSDPFWGPLVASVTHGDLNLSLTPIGLGPILKDFHRNDPMGFQKTLDWVYTAFDALREASVCPPYSGEILRAADIISRDESSDSSDDHRRITSIWLKNRMYSDTTQLNVNTVVNAMQQSGWDESRIRAWVMEAYNAMVTRQKRFSSLKAKIKPEWYQKPQAEKWRGITQFLPTNTLHLFPTKEGGAWIGFIQGEEAELSAVCRDMLNQPAPKGFFKEFPEARTHQFVALVHRNKAGNVQVYSNNKFGTTLEDVVPALRYHELIAQGREAEAERLSNEELREAGQTAWLTHVCYAKNGEMLLNGSETAPELRPLALDTGLVIRTVGSYVKFNTLK